YCRTARCAATRRVRPPPGCWHYGGRCQQVVDQRRWHHVLSKEASAAAGARRAATQAHSRWTGDPALTDSGLQTICACFGQPVAGNPTQYMMERAFAALDLDWRYLTLEVSPENLGDAIRGMRAMGFRGGNITKPHKVAVIQYLDGTSEAAGLIGAVNCIDRQGDQLIGENTDGKGFVQSL